MKKKKTFVRNDWLEHLLQVQAKDPAAFKKLPHDLQVKVGRYSEAKSRAMEKAA